MTAVLCLQYIFAELKKDKVPWRNKIDGLSKSFLTQSHTIQLPPDDGNFMNLSNPKFSAQLLNKNSNLLLLYKGGNNTYFILFVFIIV